MVDEHRCSDFVALPVDYVRMSVEADGSLFRVICNFVCLTVLSQLGVGAPLLEMRRRAGRRYLGKFAVAILENGSICPQRAAYLRNDHYPAHEGPLAVLETHARGTGPIGRESCIPLSNADSREVRGVVRLIHVCNDRVDDDRLRRCRGALRHRRPCDERRSSHDRRHTTARHDGQLGAGL